jgi:signal transduction histidine kinase
MRESFSRVSFAGQFLVLSLVILIAGMSVIGLWVQEEIEEAVTDRTAGITALYVDSFVGPHLQEFGDSQRLSAEDVAEFDRLLLETPLGDQVVSFKVWTPDGTVLYSPNPTLVGQRFALGDDLADAFAGAVVSHISDLSAAENVYESQFWDSLIETYAPVRDERSGQIVAVSEFYQLPDALIADIRSARLQSWLIVGAATLAMYLVLVGLVRRASSLIGSQRVELEDKVAHLRMTLDENEELQSRMRQAAARTTSLNAQYLHRISADLHDGPAQEVSLALLRMDSLTASFPDSPGPDPNRDRAVTDLATVQRALDSALSELRAIARDLRLPEIKQLSPADTAQRVIRDFERLTGKTVDTEFVDLPLTAPLPVKIAVYRVLQEALANSYRHADGSRQSVRITSRLDEICLVILDDGGGFVVQRADQHDALGLAGMRERVEILGGVFEVHSEPAVGTRIQACLPLTIPEADDG